ncbi:MAG: hypothetical protein HOH43_07840 [Candidatus Latescibacteria bacterium]|nr:hypothetical protein [Candidatus Latescibacterota bacterium]
MEEWTFVHVTDIHVGSPDSFRFAPAWNENWKTARSQIIAADPDFLLVGGDVARDGLLHRSELEQIKADLDSLPFPYHVIPGNMDIGNKYTDIAGPRRDDPSLNVTEKGLAQFESIFGPLWWSFDHKNIRFSGLSDIAINSGLPQEARLWRWVEDQNVRPHAARHVWLSHHAPFIDSPDEPNFNIAEPGQYHDWYFGIDEPGRGRLLESFKLTRANIVLSGHIHCRHKQKFDAIEYYKGPSTAFSQWGDRWPEGDDTLGFQRFDVSGSQIRQSFVPLTQFSSSTGYGPGGHPRPST